MKIILLLLSFSVFSMDKVYVIDFEDIISSDNLERNEYNKGFELSLFFKDLSPEIVNSNIFIVSSINKNIFNLETLKKYYKFSKIKFCQPDYYYPKFLKPFENMFKTIFFLNHKRKYECLEEAIKNYEDMHFIFIYSSYYFSNDLFKKFLENNILLSYEEHIRYLSMDKGFTKRKDSKKLYISNNTLYKRLGIKHKTDYEKEQFYLNFSINSKDELHIMREKELNDKQSFELFRYKIDK